MLAFRLKGVRIIASVEFAETVHQLDAQGEDMATTQEKPAANGKVNDKPKPTERGMVEKALAGGTNPKSSVGLSTWIQDNHGVELEPQQIADVKTQMAEASRVPLSLV